MIRDDLVRATRAALTAARLMSERLVELNVALHADLAEPLSIGIGLHAGIPATEGSAQIAVQCLRPDLE